MLSRKIRKTVNLSKDLSKEIKHSVETAVVYWFWSPAGLGLNPGSTTNANVYFVETLCIADTEAVWHLDIHSTPWFIFIKL